MENLNGKQNLRPEKGFCSYLVKFFCCAIDTVYVESTGLFFVSLLTCALVFPVRRHFEISHAQGFGR